MSFRKIFACAGFSLTLFWISAPSGAQQILLVSPALPTSTGEIRIALIRPGCSYNYLTREQGNTITLTLDRSSSGCPPVAPPDPFLIADIFLPPLAPGDYDLVVITDGNMTDSRSIRVQAPSTLLSLLQGRFTVSVAWMRSPSGPTLAANAVQLSDGSGYFWFFNSEDVDITIKMINAIPLDSHYWFFSSSGTDGQFTITVVDTWLGHTTTYKNPAGSNLNILDFTSFGFGPS